MRLERRLAALLSRVSDMAHRRGCGALRPGRSRCRPLSHVHCNNSSHEFMTSYSEDNNSSHELLLRDDACLMWHDTIRATPLKCGCCEAASSWRGAALGSWCFLFFLVEFLYFNQLSGGVCISPSKKEGFVFHGSSPRHKPTRNRTHKPTNAHHDREDAPASSKAKTGPR